MYLTKISEITISPLFAWCSSYVICVYDTGERSEPEKIDINKVKTTVGPPILAIRPNLWQIWGGFRTPGLPPPSGSALGSYTFYNCYRATEPPTNIPVHTNFIESVRVQLQSQSVYKESSKYAIFFVSLKYNA